MQQQELAQMRQRDANLTALAAIGPRKKRKVDSPGATPSGTEVRTKPLIAILYMFVLIQLLVMTFVEIFLTKSVNFLGSSLVHL